MGPLFMVLLFMVPLPPLNLWLQTAINMNAFIDDAVATPSSLAANGH